MKVASPLEDVRERPVRIVLAPSAYYPHVGGIEETTRQLALVYRRRGHSVSVLTNRWPDGVRAHEQLDSVEVTRLAFPLPATNARSAARFLATAPIAVAALLRHVHAERPDVLHVIGAGPQAAYLAMLYRWLEARVIFTGQGELTFDAHRVFDRSTSLRVGLRGMLRKANAVTACSAYVLRSLATFAEIRAPTEVIPNAVDLGDFDVAPPADEGLGQYVLAVGRLVPQKGFDVLLDSFASSSLDGLTLAIAGEGMERQRLEAKADKLSLHGRVRFLGAVERSRLAALLRGAHAFAFPSRGEAFGIALLEAMAAGVPSVAAAAGGIPEFARDGENALLVPPDDADALARALARVSSDEALRQRLSVEGRKTAAALTWTDIADRYERVYSRALSRLRA